jgi:hypothetical protein
MNTPRTFFARAGALALVLIASSFAVAQQQQSKVRLPQASPPSTLTHVVGVTDLTIVYHRPSVRGRALWGDVPADRVASVLKASSFLPQSSPEGTLDGGQGSGKDFPMVPNGHVWRAGANEATRFAVTDDVLVNGQPLKAGTYSLHTIPARGEWTIIFNGDPGQWGSFTYDEKKDVLRVKARPQAAADAKEWLAFEIDPEGENAARVNIRWEKLTVPFTVEVKDVKGLAVTKMRAAVAAAKPEDWQTPLQAASYLLGNKLDLAQAMTWTEQSIRARENFNNLNLKARILAEQGKTAEAVATGEKALQVGRAANANAQAIAAFEKTVGEWKSKQ